MSCLRGKFTHLVPVSSTAKIEESLLERRRYLGSEML